MSLDLMRKRIETVVTNAMAIQYPAITIKYENVRFTPPAKAKYIAIYILDGQSVQAELGDNAVIRYPGIVQVDCLAPEDTATSGLNVMAQFIADTLKRKNYQLEDGAFLKLRTPAIKSLGTNAGWNRKVVTIDYLRDEQP